MKLQHIIKHPYQCFTGVILNEEQCRSYNLLTDRINAFIEAQIPVPEYLINGRHNLFVGMSQVWSKETENA